MTRLAFALPLSPWPIILYLRTQGRYMWTPRHDAEALHSVLPLLTLICPVIFVVSLVLILRARRSDLTLLFWLLTSMWNGFALWQYLALNAVAYS